MYRIVFLAFFENALYIVKFYAISNVNAISNAKNSEKSTAQSHAQAHVQVSGSGEAPAQVQTSSWRKLKLNVKH